MLTDWRPPRSLIAFALAFAVGLISPAYGFQIGVNFTGSDRASEEETSAVVIDQGGGSFTITGIESSIPPDTMGGVGPNHVAELINRQYSVFDKTGLLQHRITIDDFWNDAFTASGSGAALTGDAFDPRILYDANTSRWYATSVDNRRSATSRVLVGVTTGSDPSPANWRGFAIDADAAGTRWADFETIGVNSDALFISSNLFDVPGEPVASSTITTISVPLSSLTSGTPSITGFDKDENLDGSGTFGFSLQPVVDLDGGNLPHPALASFGTTQLRRSNFAGPSASSVSLGLETAITVANTLDPLPDAPQLGTSELIETNDDRLSGNALLQNGSIWTVQTVEVSGRTAVRWYEIDEATNTIEQSGTISDNSLYYYFPSIAVNDDGDVVIGFSGSDASSYVSAYAVVGDTDGTGTTSFGNVILTKAGEDFYVDKDSNDRNRWGDYSATVLDPNDDFTFWTFQEFVAADRDSIVTDPILPGGQFNIGTRDNNWAIQITQIIVPEPDSLTICLAGLATCLIGFAAHRARKRRVRT